MWGMLADRVGRRPVLLVGLAGSAVAPLIFGLADSLAVALFARILDGCLDLICNSSFCMALNWDLPSRACLSRKVAWAYGFGRFAPCWSRVSSSLAVPRICDLHC